MNRTLIAALAATAIAVPAFASQEHSPFNLDVLASADQADAWRRWAEEFSNEMRTSMGTMFGGRVGSSRVVKNAPYSAEVTTESNQALGDGNVISKKTSGAVYRDTAGRTRQESGDGKQRTIYINDPVDGRRIVLTPGSKRAIVTPRAYAFAYDHKERQVMRVGGTEIRIDGGKVFVDGKEVTGKVELKVGNRDIRIDGLKVTIDGKDVVDVPKMSVRTITENDDGTRREEVRVQIVKSGDGREIVLPIPPLPPMPPMAGHVPPVPPVPPLPGASVMRFEGAAKLGKGTTSALGTKDFDGVRAEGKQTVWTIPAGEIGNRAPIHVTSESWYAPELQVTVYSRYNDPRQGESIYRLVGIKRGEPSPDLFRVPEGYESASRETADPKERAERDKERAERDRQRHLERLNREQERIQKERERIQREQERIEKERERLRS